MKKLLIIFITILFSACNHIQPTGKYLVILQAQKGSHEGMARAVHALMYSQELLENGHKVALIFDGAGTTWLSAMRDKSHKFNPIYEKVVKLGVAEEVCDYCSGAFSVKGELKKCGNVNFQGQYNGHPSINKWVKKGYEILII